MKRRLYIFTLLCASFFLIFSASASAYVTMGGKWSNASNLRYWKDSTVSQYGYSSHIDHGASQWNGVTTKVALSNVTSGYVDIKVFAGDTNTTDVGDALNYRVDWLGNLTACWDCTYATSVIRINNPVAKNLTPTRVNKTAAHEFGHSLGLDHSGASQAIMRQGDLGYDTLKQDDKDGIIYIYGN
ncbi:matrixin family metalloprotease [Paenibacillus sp. TC-CSREp1]|uniref:matrixin family metalloprotease n=1 Tax=Paenibacillus sp. TC-CSREp1 TaxID=3410089 RepID=UPI003CEE4FBF